MDHYYLPDALIRRIVALLPVQAFLRLHKLCPMPMTDNQDHWQRIAKRLYPDVERADHYLGDWCHLVEDENRKDPTIIYEYIMLNFKERRGMQTSPIIQKNQHQFYLILDPTGVHSHIENDDPGLSIYLYSESVEECSCHIRFTILPPPVCGKKDPIAAITWSCFKHYHLNMMNSWGVHRIANHQQLLPLIWPDGSLHIETRIKLLEYRLRILSSTHGEAREQSVMLKTNLYKLLKKERIWICDNNIPYRILSEEEDLQKWIDYRNIITIWIEEAPWTPLPCLPIMIRCPWTRILSFPEIMPSPEEVVQELRCGVLVPWDGRIHSNDCNMPKILVRKEPGLFSLYRNERRRHQKLALAIAPSIRMDWFLEVFGKCGYAQWHIYHVFMQRKSLSAAIEYLREERHIGYCCDGCGRMDFTGMRHKCTVCHDYDLCEECRSHASPFPYRYSLQSATRKWVRSAPFLEHETGHMMMAIPPPMRP